MRTSVFIILLAARSGEPATTQKISDESASPKPGEPETVVLRFEIAAEEDAPALKRIH